MREEARFEEGAGAKCENNWEHEMIKDVAGALRPEWDEISEDWEMWEVNEQLWKWDYEMLLSTDESEMIRCCWSTEPEAREGISVEHSS